MKYCVIFLLAFVSCSNPKTEWYEVNSCEDLNLIPLIKPYQMFTVGSGSGDLGWTITFFNHGKPDDCGNNFEDAMNVSRVNIKHDFIYGYSEQYSEYFAVIPSKKIEKKFNKKEDWLHYLQEIHQDTVMLYDPNEVYALYNHGSIERHGSSFGHYKELPWYSEIKYLME